MQFYLYLIQFFLSRVFKSFDIMGSSIKINTTTELDNSRVNNSNYTELPIDMRFNEGHIVSIVFYSVLMIISAIGNTTVLILITCRKRVSKSRIHIMLMHLAIADLLVSITRYEFSSNSNTLKQLEVCKCSSFG